MSQRNRPLSPHLSIYKAQLSSVISVMQRGTGAGLGVGLGCFLLWIGAAAYGPETYAWAHWILTSWLGWLVLFGVSVCLAFHLCNGVRHLIWDIGFGFEIKQVELGGLLVLGGTVVLTVAFWAAALLVMGGAS